MSFDGVSGFLRTHALKLKIYINSAKDARRLFPNYSITEWNKSGWNGLLKYAETKKPNFEEFKQHLQTNEPELASICHIPIKKIIYNGNSNVNDLLEVDKELFDMMDELLTFNNLIRLTVADNGGLQSDILFYVSDYGKICNVAIYRDMCRHTVNRLVYILMKAGIGGNVVDYLSKYNVKLPELIDDIDFYCPFEDDTREQMVLADQRRKSYLSVDSLEELKYLMKIDEQKNCFK